MAEAKELEDLKGQVDTLTTENGELKDKIEEAEKEKAKAEAQALIKEAVDKAELPDAAKARLITRFADNTTDDGVEDAIKAESDYVKELTAAGKVKGLGATQGTNDAAKDGLREALKKAHPEWSEDTLEVAVAGR